MIDKIFIISLSATLMMSCTIQQGPSEQEIQDRIDAAVKAALAERPTATTTAVTSSVNVATAETNATSEKANTSTEEKQRISLIGKYMFSDDISQWTLDVNDDGSCQIHTNGETYYGTWEYRQYLGCYWLSMSDSYYLHVNGKQLFRPQYIDIECNWLYDDSSSLKAKNPNKRVKLIRVN